jgi:hypothetical protein
MIYVIGTCHKTQIMNDQVRRRAFGTVPLSKIEAFQQYLTDTARAVGAVAIGEELTAEGVSACGHNAVSIVELVARDLLISHVFCEPVGLDREKLGLRAGSPMVQHAEKIAKESNRDFVEVHREEVRKQFSIRESYWLSQLIQFQPNQNSVVLVCGADHSQSFVHTAIATGIEAGVQCDDWTTLAEIHCPCCL